MGESALFQDRRDAGRRLAEQLLGFSGRKDVVVFGLARGGVPVGIEVARVLRAPFDVLVVRKLGAPGQEELAMGAIAPEGVRVENTAVVTFFPDGQQLLRKRESLERPLLQEREAYFRGGREYPDLHDKTVIIVDDGLATGATMRAAIAWAERGDPALIVAAAPVGSREIYRLLNAYGDRLVCIVAELPENFRAVGHWYEHFHPLNDAEVKKMLEEQRIGPSPEEQQAASMNDAAL